MKFKSIPLAILVLGLGSAFSSAQTLPQVKKAPRPTLGIPAGAPPNGEYVISVWKDGRWREAGRLAYDKFLKERELDLSPFLAGGDAPKVRISEQGPGAAHIDSVLLGGRPPEAAGGADAGRILKKISVKDDDLINAAGRSFELSFPAAAADKTLKLTARIESDRIGTDPLQFPEANRFTRIAPSSKFYSYALGGSAPPKGESGSREWLEEVGRRAPLFKAVSGTSSGHPTGPTYGWVSDDGKNLYITLDFTPDNTFDGDKDYAEVYVNCGGMVKEFRVSVPETRWGTSHFLYTDKSAYEHKVYDFVIPLSELGAAARDGRLQLAFAAYGTAAAASNHVSLAFDPDHNRYLFVFDDIWGTSYDIYGYLLDAEGNILSSIINICWAASTQILPDVAYDRESGRYLVVWQDDREGPMCSDIYGRLIEFDGSFYGSDFPIATDYLCQYRPAVANDANQHRFLVVWSQHYFVDSGLDIWGQFVDGEGNLVAPADPAIQGQRRAPANGFTNFIVSDALGDQIVPDLAFDSLANAYLVVFASQPTYATKAVPQSPAIPLISRINGQFIRWDGLPLYADTGENFVISEPALDAVDPSIANDGVNHRFLVAWADYPIDGGPGLPPQETRSARDAPGSRGSRHAQASRTGRDEDEKQVRRQGLPAGLPQARPLAPLREGPVQPFIYGRIVHTDGSFGGPERLLLTDESEALEPEEELVRSHPALAFDPFCRTYLLFYFCRWWEGDGYVSEIEGRYLDASGGIAGDYLFAWRRFGDLPLANRAPAAADNSVNQNFLVIWPEEDAVQWRIFDPECAGLPEVITAPVTDITPTSARSGGTVISDGGSEVTARGVCWNTTGGPSTSDGLTADGSGLGSFASLMAGLTPNTRYFVRAYAANSVGTAYGDERIFTTPRQFKVTFAAGEGGTVSGTLVQYVPEGGNCTAVEATAGAGFFFVNWTGTAGFTATSTNPLIVTNVQQEMAITANFGRLTLTVQKLTEKAWIIKRFYGLVSLSVDGLDPAVTYKFVLNRKIQGGAFQALKEFSSADLKANALTYEDKFLDAGVIYVYQVVAYNSGGQVIGRSLELTLP